MSNFEANAGSVLYLIVSAGGPVVRTVDRIRVELARGFEVRVIATPQAAQWLDRDEIEQLTGRRFESAMLTPAQSTLFPLGNRVLASPVTLNTLTKWADGHADNLAIGLLCEALGTPSLPMVAELSLSPRFLRHPAVPAAVGRLAAAGVEIRSHPDARVRPDWADVAAGRVPAEET